MATVGAVIGAERTTDALSGRGWRAFLPALAALVLVLTACTDTSQMEGCGGVFCGAAPPAVALRVLDAADAGIVHSARVNGFPFDCPTFCDVQLTDGGSPHGAGPVPVAVEAPGYVPQQLEVVVPAAAVDPRTCCALNFVPQQRTVLLVPL